MIDRATVEQIKATADIVEVVGDYVHLVRRGANYMGLCPFHNERTPSFSVNKSRNFCYCFSCHKGGSPVNFIMEKEGISYHEALLQLAKKYGIEVQERELTDEEREQQTRREGILVANEWAKDYFVKNLTETEEGKNIGLAYLYERKITPEAIKAFSLGYAIDKGTDFTDAALRKGFSIDVLKATGLTGTSQQGSNYDRFRGRVIFPIFNIAGKTIAFGGRDLKGANAKYINSPETEVYVKNRELYGIYQAKSDMVREQKVYLVEGYFDVIGMWQAGIRNVVASSGTALTDGQIALLHRFTENVTLIYDGDAAGIKASLRGIDMLLAHNLNVKAVPLPPGDDPDSLAAKLTPEQLKEYLKDKEVDIIRFKIELLLDESNNDPQKKWAAAKSIVESIAHIPDKIKREIYIKESSTLLNISESSLSTDVSKTRHRLVEQDKQRRRVEQIQTQNPAPEERRDETIADSPRQIVKDASPLYPLERELLNICMKYGFVHLWENEEPDEDEEMITVYEFIASELEIDNIYFTHPDYSIIFESLGQLLPQFREDLKQYDSAIQKMVENKRKEGFDRIGLKNFSINEIKREEARLEEDLLEFAKQQRDIFTKNYIQEQFCSHENDLIRRYSNDTFAEKYKLSSLFTKNKSPEKLDQKLVPTVLTALNVLKNGIIDSQLLSVMEELKNPEKKDPEKEQALYARIQELIQMRSRMAKDIGDRILSPNTPKNSRK